MNTVVDIKIQIGIFIAIIIVTVIIASLVNRFFLRMIKRATFEMKNDPTNYQFLRHFISATVYMVGIGIAVYSVEPLRTVN